MADKRLPIIIPNLDRLKLLEQALLSLAENTKGTIYPIIVDNNSHQPVKKFLKKLAKEGLVHYIGLEYQLGPGACKNIGASVAPIGHKYIYFSDNDIYFDTNWDEKLIQAYEAVSDMGILGGFHHPYHGIIDTISTPSGNVQVSDQQGGASMLIRRDLWLRFGPFWNRQAGQYGEDVRLCNLFRDNGYKIGALNPPVVYHCGLTTAYENNDTSAKKEFTEIIAKKNLALITD